ncbi:lariat debranching enzyme [Anthonomus grandis grandis]|uniref:lariat debranching enzyme n=1 Tax=Anthonomus grandis grandis TaxID=2921223 RepID=UPI00216585EB|nr:lariat debranching enzyme [Anthonomus grandis grandis]
MKIAVEGCAHGELENIYAAIKDIEDREKVKVDLLICCGDFQSSRNAEDLACMAVPPKYRSICSFYKYYSGEKTAPILTIFIGGNHEASNYLQELPYGGWVAKNIYYLGYAGVVNIAGVRIGGLSGIYKSHDYMKGHFERAPYDENAKRSVYHIRNLEVFRLKQLSREIDVFLSHDWPTGIYHHGNVNQLLKRKPFFKGEVDSNQLGSKPCEELLHHLQPKFWFAAHLHCKFAALVAHKDNPTPTRFLALDKCLVRRQFLQILDIPHIEGKPFDLEYDLEWLTVLFLTNHLLSVKSVSNYMPGMGSQERYNFTPTEQEKDLVLNKLQKNLKIPKNFRPTAPSYQPGDNMKHCKQPEPKLNPQTVEFCDILGIDDPICLVSESNSLNISLDASFYENSTFISSDSESEEDEDEEPKKLTPMKLPEPVNAICEEEALRVSPKRAPSEEVPEVKVQSDTPKFKRRNVGIYGVGS